MIVTKKFIPRRTFLRGMGTALALPLLDAMVPAAAAIQSTAASPKIRLGFFFVPNGITMDKWTPAAQGTAFETTPILEPLAPFRDQLLVLSNLDGWGGHIGSSSWLTGAKPKRSLNDVYCGVSVDQIIAREFGKDTQLESLELCIENAAELAGQSAVGYNSAYTNTISWRSPSTQIGRAHV